MRKCLFFGSLIGILSLQAPLNAQTSLNLGQSSKFSAEANYLVQDSLKLIKALVYDAADLVRSKGDAAFEEFRQPESQWRNGETYIFILDEKGNMLVHPDTNLENKNQLNLKDVNGRFIVRGILAAAKGGQEKQEGWFHYQWPVPEGLLPRWKSSFVQLVEAPDGKEYVIGSGLYDDQMNKEFVVDLIETAAKQIKKEGRKAFDKFYDPAEVFLVKDTYVFVLYTMGIDLVNPAFRNLEGRNLITQKDTQGKLVVRDMFKAVEKDSTAWIEYMWPKPGDNLSTQKSTYIKKVPLGNSWVLLGAGVYLADAPKINVSKENISPFDLKNFVIDAAAKLEKEGEAAFGEFKMKDWHWFDGKKYVFVCNLDGKVKFHAADPTLEGEIIKYREDALGRLYGRMFLETASSEAGQGWVHYVFPEPGDIFPAWKSSFIKRVTFPSGEEHLVGSGIYNMEMDEFLIEEMVYQAAALVQKEGREAFEKLRDKKGPFYFMDTYVFVLSPNGTELVNPAQPSLERKNLIDMKDLNGKYVVKEELALALDHGSGWLETSWFRPGTNTPSPKMTFVKRVKFRGETFIVGSGYFPTK